MPETSQGWVFWIFSTLFVGLAINVISGLITPRVQKSGEGWAQKRRLNKEKYRRSLEVDVVMLQETPATIYLITGGRLFGYSIFAITSFIFAAIVITSVNLVTCPL